jgi:hypothetical protein
MQPTEPIRYQHGTQSQVLGEVQLVNFYNDGGRGTGTAQVGVGAGVPGG